LSIREDSDITSVNNADHNPRRVTDMDVLIGMRFRVARVSAGLSQTVVADHLGITFQQVQKYERGANRIAATTLNKVAALFGVSILYFLEEESGEVASAEVPLRPKSTDLAMTKRGQRLLRFFAASPDKVQTAVFKLLQATGGDEGESDD
jgi:transcriptional regulator with XRE-family HTH domain